MRHPPSHDTPRPVVIDGVSEEVERPTGEAGLLIMKAVMDADVESRTVPTGQHDPDREAALTAFGHGCAGPQNFGSN